MIKERNIALDITRIIAVLAVVMIHVSSDFVVLNHASTPEFLWGNIMDSTSRVGVPLFLMISGSLMLDEKRDVSIKRILFKNIKTLACLLVLWSIIYCFVFNVLFPLQKGQGLNFERGLPQSHWL